MKQVFGHADVFHNDGTPIWEVTDDAVTASVPMIAQSFCTPVQQVEGTATTVIWDLSQGAALHLSSLLDNSRYISISNPVSGMNTYVYGVGGSSLFNITYNLTGVTFCLDNSDYSHLGDITLQSPLNRYFTHRLMWLTETECRVYSD